MDDLIAQIQDKTNLSKDKVVEVVTMVTDFMKDKMPEDLVEKVTGYLSDAGEMTGTAADKATEVAGSAAGKATEVASSAAGKATEAAKVAKDVATDATGKVVGGATSAFSKATDTVAGVVGSKDEEV